MNRLDEYSYAGLYKALKHKYKYALSTNLPCVSRHSQFLVLLCIFPELISLQESSCGSRFRLISRLFGCLKCLLLLIVRHIPEIRNDHPSLIVKAAKSCCKNTKYCSAISSIFLRSVMATHSHSPPPLSHAPVIFDELQTSLCFPFPRCK